MSNHLGEDVSPVTPILDSVPRDAPGAQEIGFAVPERYNASAILFDNLAAGRDGQVAVTGPAAARLARGAWGQCGLAALRASIPAWPTQEWRSATHSD